MTTTTPVTPVRPVPVRRPAATTAAPLVLTPARVVRAELLKLTTLRSTYLLGGATTLTLVGLGTLGAATASPAPTGTDGLSAILLGSSFAVLLAGTAGALAGAREHGSGMIRTTLATVPRRGLLVAAKAVALLAALVPILVGGVLLTYVVAGAVLTHHGGSVLSLGDATTLRILAGTVGGLAAISLIGLGLGLALRSVAGAVTAFVAVVLVLPGIAGALLPHGWSRVVEYLPSAASNALSAPVHVDGLLAPLVGTADLLGWVVLVLGGAALLLSRRDA
ncbi:ABC transporter permease [Sanguibacter sp. HDW7]|uniref:ABC transporter permease n=1 Tax=Sanguibacter sp. HDW7 TaxID=2714931 RepID=UPI0014074B37|nr:ABC transporter permease [Sanguibacter sp. HDW7]QIK83787.1 ABC transporter permease [Sanguibacter sp. HDW7]